MKNFQEIAKLIWFSLLRIYPNAFLNLRTASPAVSERSAIIRAVQHQIPQLDVWTAEFRISAAQLEDYRTARISAVVTGRFDVRGYAEAQIMLPRLTAIQLERFMTSGRTAPALCGCENQMGAPVGEYVVKLRGAIGARGLLNELFAVRLASHFGLTSPEPALIAIEPAFVELVASTQPALAGPMRGSVGLRHQGLERWDHLAHR